MCVTHEWGPIPARARAFPYFENSWMHCAETSFMDRLAINFMYATRPYIIFHISGCTGCIMVKHDMLIHYSINHAFYTDHVWKIGMCLCASATEQ